MSTASEEHYPLDSILFLEEMWGDGFLSPGGPEEVERLLAGVDLAGRTVVDIGSGAGGVPLLLANRHGAARVIGLDVEASVVAHARAKVDLPVFYGACPSGEHAPVARAWRARGSYARPSRDRGTAVQPDSALGRGCNEPVA